MKVTKNYNLNLYEANDLPNLLDGYNGSIEKIDTALKAVDEYSQSEITDIHEMIVDEAALLKNEIADRKAVDSTLEKSISTKLANTPDNWVQKTSLWKNNNWLPTGHTCQGMTTDGTYLYIAHHSESSNIFIAKIRISDKSLVADVNTGTSGHYNSMDYAANKIYASAASGGYTGDYTKLGVINTSDLSAVKIVNLPRAYWTIGVHDYTFEDGENVLDFICVYDSSSDAHIYESAVKNGTTYCPVGKLKMPSGISPIDQGIHCAQNYFVKCYSARNGYPRPNSLLFSSWSGEPCTNLVLDLATSVEIEDVCISGNTCYIDTYTGEIYSFSISNYWFNEYQSDARLYRSPLFTGTPYQYPNGSETWYNDHLIKHFTLAPCVQDSTTATYICNWHVQAGTTENASGIVPGASINVDTSNRSIHTSWIKPYTNQIAFVFASYKRSFANNRYSYDLSNIYMAVLDKRDNTWTYYTDIDSIISDGYINYNSFMRQITTINNPSYQSFTI